MFTSSTGFFYVGAISAALIALLLSYLIPYKSCRVMEESGEQDLIPISGTNQHRLIGYFPYYQVRGSPDKGQSATRKAWRSRDTTTQRSMFSLLLPLNETHLRARTRLIFETARRYHSDSASVTSPSLLISCSKRRASFVGFVLPSSCHMAACLIT